MSLPPLPADAIEMLRKPNHAVMATLRSDGAPVSAATWYLWDDDHVLLTLDDVRVRLQHLRRDPRVTLTVLDPDDWYTHVTILGTVTDIYPDEGLVDANRISQHYTGHDYPNQVRTRTSAVVRVDKWFGWGTHKDSSQPG